jgi:hypothetical protein
LYLLKDRASSSWQVGVETSKRGFCIAESDEPLTTALAAARVLCGSNGGKESQ